MATANKNAKSQLTTVRVPLDVMQGMESVKLDGESNAGFIVTAMRGEIARRQAEGSGENPLVSSLDALAQGGRTSAQGRTNRHQSSGRNRAACHRCTRRTPASQDQRTRVITISAVV